MRVSRRQGVGLSRGAVAAVLLSPVSECAGLRQKGDDGVAGRGPVLVRDKEAFQVRRIAGEQCRGIHDLLRFDEG